MLKSHTPFEHEIIQTQKLIKVFKHNPTIIEEFDENLFLQITEHIKIYPDKICFTLKTVWNLKNLMERNNHICKEELPSATVSKTEKPKLIQNNLHWFVRFFESYLQGMSTLKIAKLLTERGS